MISRFQQIGIITDPAAGWPAQLPGQIKTYGLMDPFQPDWLYVLGKHLLDPVVGKPVSFEQILLNQVVLLCSQKLQLDIGF